MLPAGAIGFDERIAALHDVSVTAFELAFLVASDGVVDFVVEVVLGVGVVGVLLLELQGLDGDRGVGDGDWSVSDGDGGVGDGERSVSVQAARVELRGGRGHGQEGKTGEGLERRRSRRNEKKI
ncbi:unnamed protein product [Nesidiocoris tenuis]|uniref:Uncharacterized protein n=1 Tax=Nesidiocoris tenuis TaxID=355587 RepID=A0A6H5HC09_9HEMI|nr:unnamed protein product [Nesidiocoris tenuis]